MFTPDDKYTGKPNHFQKIFRILFTIISVLLMFGGAVIIFNDFSTYEAGDTIRMDSMLFFLYELFGKWTVSIFIGLLGVFVGYAGYRQMIADWKIDKED